MKKLILLALLCSSATLAGCGFNNCCNNYADSYVSTTGCCGATQYISTAGCCGSSSW